MIGVSAGKIAARARAPWWPHGASYAADFVADRYMMGGVEVPRASALSFSRASSKLAPDGAGVYHAFAINEMARTDRGLWLEPESTNHVRNNTNIGAVAGSGTLPNYWSIVTSAGLSREVVALGTANGIPYMDLRIYGTANTAGPFQIGCEAPSVIAATTGEAWCISAFLQPLSMIAPPLSTRLRIREDNSGGTNLVIREMVIVPTGTLDRFVASFVLSHASTAFVRPAIGFGVSSGAAYDFTLRIGLVSLERQGVESSPIRTTGSAGICTADELAFVPPVGTEMVTYDFGAGEVQSVGYFGGVAYAPTQLSRPLRSIICA